MSLALEGASAAVLRALGAALRNGQLAPPFTPLAIARLAPSASASVVEELMRLAAEGMQPPHLAPLMDAMASVVEARLSNGAQLVWTGPESAACHSRDTAIVVNDREFAANLRARWPGPRRPLLYYDPRALDSDASKRATWHAKVIVVDHETSFVTSANFTEWAQQRNVEAGVLVRNVEFARQLRQQFEGLVQSRAVLEVPGFRG